MVYYFEDIEVYEIHSVLDVDEVPSEDYVAEYYLVCCDVKPFSYASATPFLPRPDRAWLQLLGQLNDKLR